MAEKHQKKNKFVLNPPDSCSQAFFCVLPFPIPLWVLYSEIMPSSLTKNVAEGPLVKRQKLSTNTDAPPNSLQESRIFTPFRVRNAVICMLLYIVNMFLDNWLGLFHCSTLYIHSSGKNILPNNHFSRQMSADLRSEAWAQSCLPHSATNSRGCDCHDSMEGSRVRRLGLIRKPRCMGF